MKWWKAHHGIATDRKYAVLLRRIQRVTESNALRVTDNASVTRCHVTRADILAVWVWLIDFSSQNRPRGSIDGAPTDEIATSLDLEDSAVESIMDAFRWRGMITDNSLTAFDKRQPPDDPTNAERQKRHRTKKKDSNALLSVTPLRNANSLSREDGDGDGDGETVHVNSTISVLPNNPSTSNGSYSQANGNGRDGRIPSDTSVISDVFSRESQMRSALHGYMRMQGTASQREFKRPDDVIVRRCLDAIGNTDMRHVFEFLHDRYANHQQSPTHPNGPKKYAWFVAVLAEQFGMRNQ